MGLRGVHHTLKRLQQYHLVSSCEISTSFFLSHPFQFWSKNLYTMRVHGVCVVSGIVISYCSIKIIENNKNYLKILFEKERFSLQNGCAYPLGLCKMGMHTPMVSIFMLMFFFAQRSGSTDGDDVELSPMICKCFYTLRCPAFGLIFLHNGCAWCTCCFCSVIQLCFTKIIKKTWELSKSILFEKETVFSAKWVRILPESLQNGCAMWGSLFS